MRHLAEVDGFAMLVESAGSTVALIISEAIFHTNDYPIGKSANVRLRRRKWPGNRRHDIP